MGSNLGEITPTPEMVAMAERIADCHVVGRTAVRWRVAKRAALAAIVETTERAADYSRAMGDKLGRPIGEKYEAGQHAMAVRLLQNIRNGEHLR